MALLCSNIGTSGSIDTGIIIRLQAVEVIDGLGGEGGGREDRLGVALQHLQ